MNFNTMSAFNATPNWVNQLTREQLVQIPFDAGCHSLAVEPRESENDCRSIHLRCWLGW